ncbi:hypothetical protein QFZ62_000711 [Clavibacter sp. B3I6]|uniref:hypothetical protein n=1 Tax=Clavibacter sp. B3I6 TaxID=3042268 RepID=UPI00277EDEF3|nr:hypothetical protein [Clavibacter sp. B3I6]MDQ0743403.1 hypothetical protein [Clavibacter sp. B3I6]
MITLEAVDVPTWLDYVTLAVAIISSVVIAWQAILTRSAVQASRDTVAVAESSLRESQLARLESQVPRVFVSAQAYVVAHPVMRSEGFVDFQPVQREDEFKLPRDEEVTLSIPFFFEVRNDGPGSVSLLIEPLATPVEEGASRVLGPGETRQFKMRIARSVASWVALAKNAPDETPGALSKWSEFTKVTVRHIGPRDSDVEEIHEIRLFGTILRERAKEQGSWELGDPWDDRAPKSVLVPARRIYWKSRSRNEQFRM